MSEKLDLPIDAPISVIMRHIRNVLATKSDLKTFKDLEKQSKTLNGFTESDFARSHVFDFGYVFDAAHTNFLSDEIFLRIDKEISGLSQGGKLVVPHEECIFVARSNRDRLIDLFYVQCNGTVVTNNTFSYHQSSQCWLWKGRSIFNTGNITEIEILGSNQMDDSERIKTLVKDVIYCSILLTLKDKEITVEPVQWFYNPEPTEHKSLQPKHPSVSVVKVNTARIFRTPSDAGPTGIKQRGSDVRSHIRQIGNRIVIVKEHKRNGGAPKPAIKIVQMTSTKQEVPDETS